MGVKGSGRRPKPTALKVIEGNPGRRPLNQFEPTPERGEPDRPADLGPAGTVEWDALAPALAAMGVLTRVDGQVFATYCRLVDQAATVRFEMRSASPEFVDRYRREERDIAKTLSPYLSRLGLTPADRARIVVAREDEAGSAPHPWAVRQ